MKRFKFYSETIIEAESEEEAKEKFADNSWDFAANAKCEPVEYIAYLKDNKDQWVDQTLIDERNPELARQIFAENGYDMDKYGIEIMPA